MAIAKYKISKSERRQISSKTREEKKKRKEGTLTIASPTQKAPTLAKASAKVISLFSNPQPPPKRVIEGIHDFGQIFRNWPMDGGYRRIKDEKF